jgi:hypothetical protein
VCCVPEHVLQFRKNVVAAAAVGTSALVEARSLTVFVMQRVRVLRQLTRSCQHCQLQSSKRLSTRAKASARNYATFAATAAAAAALAAVPVACYWKENKDGGVPDRLER